MSRKTFTADDGRLISGALASVFSITARSVRRWPLSSSSIVVPSRTIESACTAPIDLTRSGGHVGAGLRSLLVNHF